MENIFQKGCLIKSHNAGFICMICIDKDCKYVSRTICSQCFIESENNHSCCNNFLTFKNNNGLDISFLNKKDYDFQGFIDEISDYEKSLCKVLEE